MPSIINNHFPAPFLKGSQGLKRGHIAPGGSYIGKDCKVGLESGQKENILPETPQLGIWVGKARVSSL